MAVKDTNKLPAKTSVMMRDYWEIYRKRAYTMIVAAQIGCAIVITTLLMLGGFAMPDSLLFWVILVGTSALFLSANVIMFWILTEPLKDLVSTVVHISGEPTALTPPNPNAHNYEHDGFKEMLQMLYELAARDEQAAATPVATIDDTLSVGLNNTSTGIVILDKNHEVIYNNKKSPVRIDPSGKHTLDLLFTDDEDSLWAWLEKCEKQSVHAEHTWTRIADKLPGEKGRRVYDVTASYQKNSPAETVITLVDRTQNYTPEDDDLDFLSFAAHELRGPITVIRGYLDVLEDELQPVLKDDQGELLQRLIVSANRLSSYVSNILNASRYDRRHYKLHISEERLADIYDTIRDDMQLRASSQNRLLSVDIPDNLPTVAADTSSIGEVMSNLIDNAIKYSNEGGLVRVTAQQVRNNVEVSVIDRGIGMPASVVQNLFHKFYRSHRSRETVAGTGIGLYISKAIVESHGGIITARSTEREGSTFTFTLPVYDTVAEKLHSSDNSNEKLIKRGSNWIKNHSMYRG